MKLLIVLLCFVGPLVNGEYLFTIPRAIVKGSTAQASLQLVDYATDGDIEIMLTIVSLTHNDASLSFERVLIGQERQFTTAVAFPPHLTGFETFTVTAMVNNDILFEKNITINIYRVRLLTLVQTDKPMYKPGQKVQFRVMTMDYRFTPQTEGYTKITIQAPNRHRVMQWDDVPAPKGLVSLEMQLSDDPLLGTWVIMVQEGTKETRQTFKVEEYVLPKYEVTITPPKYLLPTTVNFTVTVCAKYTYGKNVKGTAKLNVCFHTYLYGSYYTQRPCTGDRYFNLTGCEDFTINAADIKLGVSEDEAGRYTRWGTLRVNATVTEEATGVALEGYSEGPGLSFNPLTLTLSDNSNNFYKAGFPYKAVLKAMNPDGSPAPGELINIDARDYGTNSLWIQNLTTGVDGTIPFSLTGLGVDNGRISIYARPATEDSRYITAGLYFGSYTQSASLYIQQWVSPSASYIHIPDIEDTVKCNSTLKIPVYYNTNPETRYTFHVVVKAGGQIVHTMDVENYFDGSNPDDLNQNQANMLPKGVIRTLPPLPPLPTLPANSSNSTAEPEPEPVDEEVIEPEEVSPLGEDDGTLPAMEETAESEGLTPVEEEPIVPETFQPLGDSAPRRRREADSTMITHFMLDIDITKEMAPGAVILVYYIRDDLEVVASSVKVNIKSCFRNPVKMTLSNERVRPGENVTFDLTTTPFSYCALGMVDKSIQLLGGNSMLTPDRVFQEVNRMARPYHYYSYWQEDREYCKRILPEPRTPPSNHHFYWNYYYDVTGADAIQAFRDSEMYVLTDTVLETRNCTLRQQRYYDYPMMRLDGGSGQLGPGMAGVVFDSGPMPMNAQIETVQQEPEPEPETKIRSHFPETWLWNLYAVGSDGTLSVTETAPDTITEWVGNSVCTNQETGIGITEMTGVTTFQPFFVSFTLPYSVVRGEIVPVLTTVFNYMADCLPIRITLKQMEGFAIQGSDVTDVCVCGGESKSYRYRIEPTLLGEIDLEATAVVVEDTLVCENEIISSEVIHVSDGVQRQLLVEAEGVPQDLTKNFYMCPNGNEPITEQVSLTLPDNFVPDSQRGSVSVIGDIMGPTLTNLKRLLRVPYGCGEQNMASLVPNIYVLQYLSSTGQIDPETDAQARNNMRIGYQRQLKYRHRDGSYSAFGDNKHFNKTGSTWLTTFVVKSLAQSMPYITIDTEDIQFSMDWLIDSQNDSGCFPLVGKVYSQYMKGGLADEDNTAGLTAFIVIALLEAHENGVNTSDSYAAVLNGLNCLDSQPMTLDTYTLSVMLYAYTLYDVSHPRCAEIMEELDSRANVDVPGQKYWSRKKSKENRQDRWRWQWYRAPSAEVEMTSYVLLSILKAGGTEAIIDAQPIVQWLTEQRNPYGGFSSTQDTVMALQGLSMFGSLTYSGNYQVNVAVRNSRDGVIFEVNEDNSLLYQTKPVNIDDGDIYITASGSGCAMVQVNMKFNVIEEVESGPAFNLQVGVYRSELDINNCAQRSMEICTRYLRSGVSGMAIVSVKMVTGWIPVKSTLDKLPEGAEGVEKYEIENNMVQIYFEELAAEQTCFRFEVLQDIEMNTLASLVRVYDYYETQDTVVSEYSIKTTCGTKEELPFTDEFDFTDMEQRRLPNSPLRWEERSEAEPGPGPEPQPQPEEPMTCPLCWQKLPEDFKDIFCSAKAVYKAWVARNRDYPIKIKADIRNKEKIILDDFVNYRLGENCNCPILVSPAAKRALIFADTTDYDSETWTMHDGLIIVPWTARDERKIRNLLKNQEDTCSP